MYEGGVSRNFYDRESENNQKVWAIRPHLVFFVIYFKKKFFKK
jgi:hypothetical protein